METDPKPYNTREAGERTTQPKPEETQPHVPNQTKQAKGKDGSPCTTDRNHGDSSQPRQTTTEHTEFRWRVWEKGSTGQCVHPNMSCMRIQAGRHGVMRFQAISKECKRHAVWAKKFDLSRESGWVESLHNGESVETVLSHASNSLTGRKVQSAHRREYMRSCLQSTKGKRSNRAQGT